MDESIVEEGRYVAPVEEPVSFRTFAATIGPRPVRDDKGRVVAVTAGAPEEIWTKFLRMNHGGEKHTMSEWRALIAGYGVEPAHPAGMGG